MLRAVVLVAALAIPVSVHADEDPAAPAAKSGMAPAEREVAPVEPPSRVLEPEKRMPETRNATEPAFVWKPFGFVRLQYIAVQDDPNVAFVGRDDGFELQNARVGFVGQLGTKAAITVDLDGAVDERAQTLSPSGVGTR